MDINKKKRFLHKTRIIILGITFFVIFGILLLIGIIPRIYQHKEVILETKPPVPTVYTTKPSFIRKIPALDLPGNISPYLVTSIYSRVSGTLKARCVDIGYKVHNKQLLAVIDVPDLDKEFEQAKAQLVQSKDVAKQAEYNYLFAKEAIRDGKKPAKAERLLSKILNSMKTTFIRQKPTYRLLKRLLRTMRLMLSVNLLYNPTSESKLPSTEL